MSSFAQLKAALRNWPKPEVPSEHFAESPHERLRCALQDLQKTSAGFGAADLAVLVRQALRFEAVQSPGIPKFTVPNSPPWPDKSEWEGYGCRAKVDRSGFLEVEANAWEPSWLPQSKFSAVEGLELRRPNLQVPADPALRERYKAEHYLSPNQAEAVRAVMLSPPGSVRLVILPTGAGKSLVGLSAALLGKGESEGVSIFIVPTIALAQDQVRQARNLCNGAQIDAWQSSLTPEERRTIKDRLRNGTQRVLYAAPESIVGTLAEVLYELAGRGALRAFVVDEAHLVGHWGTSFRPEFQSMAALWRELRTRCPEGLAFRTLLMTATLTNDSFADLIRFFGPADEIETLAGVCLRPEPDYFSARCENEQLRIERVLETLSHGPRPAILYVTEVEDAKEWHKRCVAFGWRRTGLMHGECNRTAREQTLTAWNANQLDLMVATSAFGLGMDKADVRMVIHACVPETLDRFYQEVGRGGRDGRASASIMLWTDDDRRLAQRMSSPAIISEELGFDRWKSMWTKRRVDGDDHLVDMRAKRPGVMWDGERNATWNLRTLLLLTRAGVLEIKHRPFPETEKTVNESEDEFQLRNQVARDDYEAHCPIKLLQPNPLTASSWEKQVGSHRDQSKAAAATNWRRMESMLRGRQSRLDLLREVYCVPAAGIHHVATEARGLTIVPPRATCIEISEQLRRLFPDGGGGILLVTYRTNGVSDRDRMTGLIEVLKRLAKYGVREVALPSAWRNVPMWPGLLPNPLRDMTAMTPEKFLIVRDLDELDPLLHGYLAVPRVSLIPPQHANRPIPEFLMIINRPLHLILVPEECPDHRHPARRVGDVSPPVAKRLEDFQRMLKQ